MPTSSLCPFCEESRGESDPWFRSIYSSVPSRRVAAWGRVFAIPTVGQLFAGSLLVVADRHVDRFAEATDLHSDVIEFLSLLTPQLEQFGTPLVYEHGALCDGGSGCGIYHAHMHIVPLPDQPSLCDLTGLKGLEVNDLNASWQKASGGPDYLVVQVKDETRLFTTDVGFGSQFMRKRLVERYGLNCDWNWRTYRSVEPAVMRTLSHFGVCRGISE